MLLLSLSGVPLSVGSHPFVNTNNSAIDGAGVDHIFEVVDEEGDPGKADPYHKAENCSNHPDHCPILIVDHSSHLCVQSDNKLLFLWMVYRSKMLPLAVFLDL